MPLINSFRFAAPGGIPAGAGTQTVTGTLDVSGGGIVEFNATVFPTAGTYTIFTYSTLVLGAFASFSAAVTTDFGDTGFTSVVYTDTGSSITATLS